MNRCLTFNVKVVFTILLVFANPVFLSGQNISYIHKVDTRLKATLSGNQGKKAINSISFTNDGKYLIAVSYDAILKWDLSKYNIDDTIIRNTYSAYGFRSVAILDQDKFISTFGSGIYMWPNTSETECSGSKVNKFCKDDDDDKYFEISTLPHARSIKYNRENNILAVAGEVFNKGFSRWGIRLIPLEGSSFHFSWCSKELYCNMKGHNKIATTVDFKPDGKTLASGSDDKTIILWDFTSGKKIKKLRGHNSSVKSVAFSPDGKLLASGSFDRTIILWDVQKKKKIRILKGHTDGIWEAAFSPDGRLLASASQDKTVKLWDPTTGNLLTTLKGHTDYVYCVAFSPDGKYLATAGLDTTIKIWEINQDVN